MIVVNDVVFIKLFRILYVRSSELKDKFMTFGFLSLKDAPTVSTQKLYD